MEAVIKVTHGKLQFSIYFGYKHRMFALYLNSNHTFMSSIPLELVNLQSQKC